MIWVIAFAGIALCPMAFSKWWGKRWFKISWGIFLFCMISIALRSNGILR